MNMVEDVRGEFFDLDKAVKIIKDNDLYKVTFQVPIKLNDRKSETYIQKDFKNIEIPDHFLKVDDKLYLDLNKILKVSFHDGYALLTSNTKKKIGSIFLNYNIKITGQNEIIKEKIKEKGVEMNGSWISVGENLFNLDNVTNVYANGNKVIFNFINSATSKKNLIDIKPEYEVQYMDENSVNALKELLKQYGMIEVDNKLINPKNVYNIKIFKDNNVCFINFVSNISKVIDGQKVVSTEFVKYEANSDEEFKKFLENFGIKI